MQLDDVKTFLRIVSAKTLGQCAEQMHLTQSTISKRLQRLERDIGVKLIERSPGSRTVHLTIAGNAFMDIAHRWLDIKSEVTRLSAAGEQLPLSIGSLASQNMAFLTRMFTRLAEYAPLLRLTFRQRHSDEMYTLVERRDIQVGFSLLDLYNPSVKVKPCYQEPMVGLRRAPGKPPCTERTVRVRDLDPVHELYMEWSNVLRVWHEQHWDPMALGRVRVDNVTVIMGLLRDSRQWAILPHSLAVACAQVHDFEVFRLDPPPPDRLCYALTHKYPSRETRRVLAIFNEMLMETLTRELGEHGKIFPNPILDG